MGKSDKPGTSTSGKRTTTTVQRSTSTGRYVAKPDTSGPVWQVSKSGGDKQIATKVKE